MGKHFGLIILVVLGFGMKAGAGVVMDGDVPTYASPGLQQKLDQIWEHERARYLVQSPVPPEIHFYEFDRQSEPVSFQEWQNKWLVDHIDPWHDWAVLNNMSLKVLTPDWIKNHVDSVFPFKSDFRALHYEDTNQIQLSPKETFLLYYVVGPYGNKEEHMGYGYYSSAHEMLHYVFAQRGIPEKLHHCLFVSPQPKVGKSPIQEAVDYLIEQNISSPMINRVSVIVEESFSPCDQLSDAERAQVASLAATLDDPK